MRKLILAIALLLCTAAAKAQIQSATLVASGLTCSMCSKAIYKALLKVPAIEKVDADVEHSSYIITFKPNAMVSPEALRKAVEGAGFSIAQLKLTANIPRNVVKPDSRITFQGATYRLIRAGGKELEGTQTFTVVDKPYIAPSAYKQFAKDIPAGERDVFHITL